MGAFDLGKMGTVKRCWQRLDGKFTVDLNVGKNPVQVVHHSALEPGKSVRLSGAGKSLRVAS